MTLFKKQLGFALPIAILIVIVLIVAGGAGYYFYKTSVEKAELPVAEEKIGEEKEVLEETEALVDKYSACGCSSGQQCQVDETCKIISVCGDKKCEGGDENKDTCPRDCESKEEYAIFEEGRFAVLVPKGYELLGERHLQDLKYCYPLISNFFGITPYYNTTFLKIFIGEKNAGYSNGIGIFYRRTKENIDRDFNDAETSNPEGFLYKSSPTYCANIHEFVHVFVGHLSLPSWANEGIAEYTQKNIQKGSKDDFECKQDGWYGFDYWVDEEEKFFPYSNLSKPSNNDYLDINYGPKWYRTAMCLWEYIDTKYGKIKEIFQKFDNLKKEGNFRGSFVDEILVPVLGIDTKQVLAERFGL